MRHFSILATILIVCWGCSSTKVTNSWTKPGGDRPRFSNILVLALTGDHNRELAVQMESHVAAALQKQGYNAISAFETYGPVAYSKTDEQAAMSRFKTKSADAILTIVLLDKAKENSYVPSRVSYYPQGMYYNHFWGYYATVYDRVYTPGYYQVNTRYFWESNLYDIGKKK